MPNPDYIDNCISTISSLAEMNISGHPIGVEIGSGSMSTMYALGKFGAIHCGLKLPSANYTTISRAVIELPAVDMIYRNIPELRSKLPSFVGAVALGNIGNIVGLITEDVSQGGTLVVDSMPASALTQTLLQSEFGDPTADLNPFREYILNESFAFRVAGQERLLDFTPPPVEDVRGTRAREEYRASLRKAREKKKDYTLVIPDKSVLGVQLHSMVPQTS